MRILKTSSGRNPEYLSDYETYTHKECSKCKEVKPVDQFSKSTTKGNRIGWAYRSYCKDCGNQQTSVYAARNKEKRNARLRAYRKENPEKAVLYDKRGRYKKKYGITLLQLESLKKSNDYKCWICNQPGKKLFLDHCHTTGKVRGILCPSCNTYLGRIKDSVETLKRAIDYLEKPCHADLLLRIANEP